MKVCIKKWLLPLLYFVFINNNINAQSGKGVIDDDLTGNEIIGRTRALIIGISKYQYIDSLEYADKDAEEFYRFLSANKFWNVPSDDIKLLTNQQAKCYEIITELSRMIQVSKPGDRVLFYFSGHGDIETITQFNNGYLLAYDTYKNNYITGAIPVNFLKEVFLTLLNKGVKVFMFTDACRSGNLAGGLKGTEFAASAISTMWKNEIKILSSQPGQLSYEDKKWGNGRGVFSYYLTQGLSGAADDNKDSSITLSELEVYVGKNVAAATGNKQQPIFEGPNKFSTIVARVFQKLPDKSKSGGKSFMKTKAAYKFDNDSCTGLYKYFDEAINLKKFVNTPASAISYYQQLRSCSNDTDLVLRANGKLIAALMDSVQQIVNNSLVGKKLVNEISYTSGIQLLEEILKNNDIKIPETRLKNLKRYFFVTNQVLWQPTVPAKTYQTSYDIIDSALKDEPDAAYLLNAKGIVYLALDKYTEAITVLEKALLASPTWLMPKYYLGITYAKQKKYQKALRYYEEIFSKDPLLNTFECTKCIIKEMAELSIKLKDNEKAIKYYNKNLDLFPEYYDSYEGLSDIIIQTKNKKAADDLINRLSVYKDSVYAFVLKTQMVMAFYKKDKSAIRDLIDSVEMIVKDRFDSADLELLRGEYARDFDIDYDEAYGRFTNAMNLVPDDLFYISNLVELLQDYDKYKEIEELILSKISNYSKEDQPELLAALGISYLGQKKLKEGFTQFKTLHESGSISCAELKDLNKYLKKLPEYNNYMKNCTD